MQSNRKHDNAIIYLIHERRARQIAESKAQLAEAKRAIHQLENALYVLIDAAFDSRAPIATISNLVRRCEAALLQRARELRGQGKPRAKGF